MDWNRIINGIIRAAKLDVAFYEEVEKDTSYRSDALAVVIIASVAGAIGTFLTYLFTGHFVSAILWLIFTGVINVVVYFLWAFLIYYVGVNLFKGKADFGEVQRCLGFAWGPRILSILSFIPVLNVLIGFIVWIWSIATGFIATRQSLDQDNTNAALTVIVAGIVAFIVQAILIAIVGAILLAIGLAGAAATGLFK